MRSPNTRVFLLTALFSLAVSPLSATVNAASPYLAAATDGMAEPSLWGIENGCLNTSLVRHFYVLDAHAAVIELIGGKRVLMRFRGDCQGVEQYGFVHTAHNNQVCARANAIRVLQTGTHCDVESLEPYPSP
ncbi:hypothetical protein [Porticoccus sp.]